MATGGLFLDRKDDTDVSNSAATVVLTGAGQINIESSLATGGIGISTLAAAPIVISSGQGVGVTAAADIVLTAAGSAITIRDEANAAKIDVRASRDGTDADTAYVNLDVDNLESSIGCQNGATFAQYVASGSAGNAEISTTGEIKLTIGGVTQARLAGSGNIGVGGGGSDGSVFLLKNDDSLYGALNYNGTNDTLNIDNGGSGISVGASGITMTPATGIVEIVGIPSATKSNILYYDSATNAVSYGSPFPAVTVQPATGTIALTEAMNRVTYILTGTSATQSFSQAGLVGVAAGWTVYLRNGNNATGLTQDITISIPAGNTTLHAPTGTTNSSFILLYWNGSALAAYR